jgi:hypothetical protein
MVVLQIEWHLTMISHAVKKAAKTYSSGNLHGRGTIFTLAIDGSTSLNQFLDNLHG